MLNSKAYQKQLNELKNQINLFIDENGKQLIENVLPFSTDHLSEQYLAEWFAMQYYTELVTSDIETVILDELDAYQKTFEYDDYDGIYHYIRMNIDNTVILDDIAELLEEENGLEQYNIFWYDKYHLYIVF